MDLYFIADEAKREDYAARLRGFRPIDDTFMRKLFKDDEKLAQFVLRIIMAKDDLEVTECKTQADMKMVTGARSLSFDVYATDSTKTKYDIEVQRASSGANPYRATYHTAMLAIDNLMEGQEFEALPQMYTVFITEKDVFQKGLPLYPIEWINTGLNESFGSPAHILYVNGAYRGENPLGRLMHDFNCSDPGEMFYPEMAEKARYYKENPKGVREMCEIMEDLAEKARKEGKLEGIKEGIKEGTVNTLVALVRKNLLSVKDAAEQAGLAVEAFQKKMTV